MSLLESGSDVSSVVVFFFSFPLDCEEVSCVSCVENLKISLAIDDSVYLNCRKHVVVLIKLTSDLYPFHAPRPARFPLRGRRGMQVCGNVEEVTCTNDSHVSKLL